MISTTELLARLVAFPTVSRDPNNALIGFAAGLLREAGFRVRVLPGRDPAKANLFASFGPEANDGLILSGHSDVVPVDGQSWSADPFTLSQRGPRLQARGATDMKGFIASMLHTAARLQGQTLSRPLHVALSHDEEIGCVGVRDMLDTLAAEGFKARGCIIGEPTGLAVAIGHKGKVNGCIHCVGEAAHSADPEQGSNAIYLAADMVEEVRAMQDWLRAQGARDAAYAVPHSTLHIGTIEGGTALNIVPADCRMKFEIRHLPGDAPAALLDRLRAAGNALAAAEHARGRHAAVEISIDNSYPGLETGRASLLARLVGELTGANRPTKINFGTEGGLFSSELGIPTVVCGPGSIDRAHKADEFVTTDELGACDKFLERVVETLR